MNTTVSRKHVSLEQFFLSGVLIVPSSPVGEALYESKQLAHNQSPASGLIIHPLVAAPLMTGQCPDQDLSD